MKDKMRRDDKEGIYEKYELDASKHLSDVSVCLNHRDVFSCLNFFKD